MANAYSTQDLLKGALHRAGERTDGNSQYHSRALSYMNDFYGTVIAGGNEFEVDLDENWIWARDTEPKIITLQPAYETGTVSLTQGLTSGTFSAAPALSQQGKYLKVGDRRTLYKISSHTAGVAAFTLDTEYIEETGTGLAYKAIKLVYDIGEAIQKICEPMRHYAAMNSNLGISGDEAGKISALELNAFRESFPRYDLQEGIPTRFAIERMSESLCQVVFNRYPEETMKVEADVIKIPEGLIDTSTSIPLVPRAYRVVLETATAHHICVDKQDDKATYFFNLTKAKLLAMKKQNRKDLTHASRTKGQFFPRQEQTSTNRKLYF